APHPVQDQRPRPRRGRVPPAVPAGGGHLRLRGRAGGGRRPAPPALPPQGPAPPPLPPPRPPPPGPLPLHLQRPAHVRHARAPRPRRRELLHRGRLTFFRGWSVLGGWWLVEEVKR